jgi:hypothetical protein
MHTLDCGVRAFPKIHYLILLLISLVPYGFKYFSTLETSILILLSIFRASDSTNDSSII